MPDRSPTATDRYVSFNAIDFEGNVRVVLGHLFRYINDPAKTNPFWERFKQRLAKAEADAVPVADRLLLLHSHVYYMVELFEEEEDEEALTALRKLEEECF
ncbi:MAG: N(2)-fixation sustaining protein CowN [Rhizomicrobium sp.]